MLFGALTNNVADAVPLLGGPLNSLPWYLPPHSQANRSATSSSLQMGPGIFGSFGDAIDGGVGAFSRIARHYQAVGGMLADLEAAPVLTLKAGTSEQTSKQSTVDLGEEYRLILDTGTGVIAVEQLATGTLTPIWGQDAGGKGPELRQESWFGLDNGTALAIETAPAPDHANGFIPARIDINRDGRTLSLKAVG
ncbi:DUF1521 domain-containing protein [Sphingobium aromaticiconvertens]|uniref:DUF1521 domain-containing protein n=1 Tax=Sphingobium aromaticiconvertens TaxID=365341 RepID=UPI00301605C7